MRRSATPSCRRSRARRAAPRRSPPDSAQRDPAHPPPLALYAARLRPLALFPHRQADARIRLRLQGRDSGRRRRGRGRSGHRKRSRRPRPNRRNHGFGCRASREFDPAEAEARRQGALPLAGQHARQGAGDAGRKSSKAGGFASISANTPSTNSPSSPARMTTGWPISTPR